MLKNIKNEILNKPSFSKVISIVESTIHALKGGGKNLGGKSLVCANISLKTILFGLLISLLTLQCSKSTDTATPAPAPGPTPVQNDLVLSVSSLTMYAANGYTASFTITTDQNWTITGAPNWLIVSTTSGGPGTGLKVNLTTTTLNTTPGLTGSLSVNATGKPELNKTLNLTRTHYTTCGDTLGLPGPSIVVAKWVSVGAGDHSAFNDKDPNSRFLVAVAKGCTSEVVGWKTLNVNLFKNANFIGLGFIKNGSVTIYSSTVYFTNSPFAGLSSTPVDYQTALWYLLFKNYQSDGDARIDTIYNDSTLQGGVIQPLNCNANNQYLLRNFLSSDNANGAQTCITDTQFPPELKDTMNDLLRGAGKTYRIP